MPDLRELAAVIYSRSYLSAFANTPLTASINLPTPSPTFCPEFSKNVCCIFFRA
jgi:hypothetical protein